MKTRRTFRKLPPAGGFASPGQIIDGIFKVGILARKEFRDRLLSFAKVPTVIIGGSGKESLYRIFDAAKAHTVRRTVLVSAYTCPDIATAAIKANFKLYLLDIDEKTLAMRTDIIDSRVKENAAFVVLSNLYGLPDAMEPWFNFRAATGCGIIDDACQSFFSRRGEFIVGGMPSTLGVVSFGRGKAVCGVGGGALLIPAPGFTQQHEKSVDQSAAHDLRTLKQSAGGGGLGESIKDFLSGTLASFFEKPELYWIPSKLPFLGLGETEVKTDFPVGRPSLVAMLHGLVQLQYAEKTALLLRANAAVWAERLKDSSVLQPFVQRGGLTDPGIVPIRYPVVFENEEKTQDALAALAAAGLGASGSYPATLNNYPELRAFTLKSNISTAQSVASRIVTLPLHRGVKEGDIEHAAAIIKNFS